MKIWLGGAMGQLGSQLRGILAAGHSELGSLPEAYRDARLICADCAPGGDERLDITDADAVMGSIMRARPDVVINLAAMTQVDACEAQRDDALRFNALGARNVAIAAAKAGARMMQLSSDYVFAGDRTDGIPYAEWDEPGPRTVYGATKLMGERYVQRHCPESYIVRISWLYGHTGGNFVRTILRYACERGRLDVVNDQLGNPTYAEDLAHHMLLIALTSEWGVYHVTGSGICSWYDFAREIVALSGTPCEVTPIKTDQSGRAAPRPLWSALDHTMLRLTVGDGMRNWREALGAFIDIKEAEPWLPA